LGALGHALTLKTAAEVEITISSIRNLRRSPVSMFYYDLLIGHRQLYGRDSWQAAAAHHRRTTHLPRAEGTQLLIKRGSGMLLARDRLDRTSLSQEDLQFIGRNIAKAQLALGDVLLTVYGQYHWSCLERNSLLLRLQPQESLPWLDSVRHHHDEGVEFK